MPAGIHLKRARTYRPDPDVYEKAKAAVAEVDSDMNAYINAFLLWLIHETDELPTRPPKLPPS
ncbi:hypothetical protein [Streptomyces sp. WM6349]|uniref:hypothetical protein n=1 Tax=Streptomyces sp. WM6349 TaxID=1415552 RepID=UPI0006AF40DE|nr:hypothetical protein [Streptomyces sp. WM6349]